MVFRILPTYPHPDQVSTTTHQRHLTTGSTYALIALGYAMIYGILGLINFV